MMKRFLHLQIALVLLLWTGCAFTPDEIRDLRDLSQDPAAYVDAGTAARPLVPPSEQGRRYDEFLAAHFAPWTLTSPLYLPDEVRRFGASYVDKLREAKPRWPKRRIRVLTVSAALKAYPSLSMRGITVRPDNLRGLPTRAPAFLAAGGAAKQALKGLASRDGRYPFDRLQVSYVAPNTPVRVRHRSTDRRWFLVETGFAVGWLPAAAVAEVDDAFIAAWRTGTYVAPVRDGLRLADDDGSGFLVGVGSLFPWVGDGKEAVWVAMALRGDDGRAELSRGRLPKAGVARMPMPLTVERVAAVARELVGTPYGWGGKGGRRDCSSLLRDLYVPFGLWLPRHSADQAREGGVFVDLSGWTREDKKTLLLTQGAPFRTLLWRRGHVMLYIGTQKNEPLIFHNFWSIRVQDEDGERAKKVVGKAAITTLNPGKEFQPPEAAGDDILTALRGMTLVGAVTVGQERTPASRAGRPGTF